MAPRLSKIVTQVTVKLFWPLHFLWPHRVLLLLVSSHHYLVFLLYVPRPSLPRLATLYRVQSIQSVFSDFRASDSPSANPQSWAAGQTLFTRSIPCLFLSISLEKKDLKLRRRRTRVERAQVAQGIRVPALFVTNAGVKLAMQFRTLHLDWQPTHQRSGEVELHRHRQVQNKTLGSGLNSLMRPAEVRDDVKTNFVNT